MNKSFYFTAAYFFIILITLHILKYIVPSCITNTYVGICCIFTSVVFSYYVYPWVKRWYLREKVSPSNKAVFITGCDRGFGHELAKRLQSAGYLVFAGCLFPEGEGAVNLKKLDRLHVLELDVTKDEEITKAVHFVEENLGKTELWAVMNNAGIYSGSRVAISNIENYQACWNVNTLGPIRVTKAFLPLLRCSKGRVVITSSIVGRIASSTSAAYTISKFAITGFSECLRRELKPWGIKVITIEPSAFRTPLIKNTLKYLREHIASLDKETIAALGEKYFVALEDEMKNIIRKSSDDIYKVVDAMEDAISLEEPSIVYQPAKNIASYIVYRMLSVIPYSLLQLYYKV